MKKIVDFLEQNPRFVALVQDNMGDWRIFEYPIAFLDKVQYSEVVNPTYVSALNKFSYSRLQIENLRDRIYALPDSFWSEPVTDRWEEEPPITLVKDSVVFVQLCVTLSPVEALNAAPPANAVPQ